MSLEKYSLKMPKAVYSGTNSMENIPAILAAVGAKKVAAFTDKGIRKLGLFDLVEEQLKASGVAYDVFDEFPPEPSYQAVQGVIDQFKHKDYDFVVAGGGGSVMDTAKLASVLVTDEYGVKELLDDPKRAKKCLQILTIPTTAGTGAECTSNAMLLIPVMKFNAEDPKFRDRLALAWDAAYHGDKKLTTVDEKAYALVDWMEEIVKHLDIPTDLKEFGVKPEHLDGLVEAGLQQQRLLVNNMREVKAEDARKIYLQVM